MAAFHKKMELWEKLASRVEFTSFSTFDSFTKEDLELRSTVHPLIATHLSNLRKRLVHYFGDTVEGDTRFKWIVSPFTTSPGDTSVASLPVSVMEQLIDVASDIALKATFATVPLTNFWSRLFQKYPLAATVAMVVRGSF